MLAKEARVIDKLDAICYLGRKVEDITMKIDDFEVNLSVDGICVSCWHKQCYTNISEEAYSIYKAILE